MRPLVLSLVPSALTHSIGEVGFLACVASFLSAEDVIDTYRIRSVIFWVGSLNEVCTPSTNRSVHSCIFLSPTDVISLSSTV